MENDRKFADVEPQMREFLEQYPTPNTVQSAEKFLLSQTPQDNLEPVLPHSDVMTTIQTSIFYIKFFNDYEELEKAQTKPHSLRKKVIDLLSFFDTWKDHTSVDYYVEHTSESIQAGDMVRSLSLKHAHEFAFQKYEAMVAKLNSNDYTSTELSEYTERAQLWKKRSDMAHWGVLQENKPNKPKR